MFIEQNKHFDFFLGEIDQLYTVPAINHILPTDQCQFETEKFVFVLRELLEKCISQRRISDLISFDCIVCVHLCVRHIQITHTDAIISIILFDSIAYKQIGPQKKIHKQNETSLKRIQSGSGQLKPNILICQNPD